MSLLLASEFRLFYAVLLNALVLASAWQLARRFNRHDLLHAAGDALLLFYLVQYLSICVPGVVGALHPATIALVALLLSSAMAVGGMRRAARSRAPDLLLAITLPDERSRTAVLDYGQPASWPTLRFNASRIVVIASALFLLGYVGALVYHQRQVPVISNDALTYHLPAAVQWLQAGRLGLYETWFYNPANSYSPLAGSAFIAWLIAALGNDVLARFVAVGPLIFLFVAMLNLCRGLGASLATSSLLALAIVLARSFVSQTILAKDDLFVAAFFITLIDAMRAERLETRFGPWRVGIALGLLLATKYTVLLSLPIVLLMVSRAWNVRRAAIALVVALLLAGPWYLRNALLTGNPLYPTALPLLPGMLHLKRSDLLATPGGVWWVFVKTYYAIPIALTATMIAGWLAAWIVPTPRRFGSDALRRTVLIGPIVGMAIFVTAAPYGEMRFAYPAILLLFAASAMPLARLPEVAQLLIAAALALSAGWSAFHEAPTPDFMLAGGILAAVGVFVSFTRHAKRIVALGSVLLIAAGGVAVYVYWDAYIKQCDFDSSVAWASPPAYPEFGPAWTYVRKEIPRGATIAYANTYFTYPLMGYAYDHRVVYAPTRRGLERFTDIPPIAERITGEAIPGHIVELLRQDPDRDQWLRRLRETGATYLVVMKRDPAAPAQTSNPPELGFAEQDPAHFQRVYDDQAGSVFRIAW